MIYFPRLLQACIFMAVVVMLLAPASPIRAASLQEEFDALCINTQDAENLPLEKLQALVAECDKLKEAIEKSSDPKKKVLLFRLKKCRNFLAFIIETKQSPSADSSQ